MGIVVGGVVAVYVRVTHFLNRRKSIVRMANAVKMSFGIKWNLACAPTHCRRFSYFFICLSSCARLSHISQAKAEIEFKSLLNKRVWNSLKRERYVCLARICAMRIRIHSAFSRFFSSFTFASLVFFISFYNLQRAKSSSELMQNRIATKRRRTKRNTKNYNSPFDAHALALMCCVYDSILAQ